MISRFPRDLPWFCAALVGLVVLAWLLGSTIAGSMVDGRPSSTAGLAFVFAPVFAAGAAVVGLLAGALLRGLVRVARPSRPPRSYRPLAWALLLVVPVLAALLGARTGGEEARRYEARAKPRILTTTEGVERQVVEPGVGAGSRAAEPIWGTSREGLPTLVGDETSGWFEGGGRRSSSIDLAALDYVTSADALALYRAGEPVAYAALINGRATGRRAVLVILSTDLRVLHSELVERWWRAQESALCVVPAGDGTASEDAFLGCRSTRAIRYRLVEEHGLGR